jgi:hypothetical protein
LQFSGLQRSGSREKPLEIILPGVDKPVQVLVRATGALEDADATRFASDFAKSRGSSDPQPGDPRYDCALWAAVVASAYLDKDSPVGQRQAFFKDPNEVLAHLSTDSVAYLFQSQQAWQEEVSPTFKCRTNAELVQAMRLMAEKDGEVFFSRLSPFMQTTLALFMAGLLANSPGAKLPGGSPSDKTTSTPFVRRPRGPGLAKTRRK